MLRNVATLSVTSKLSNDELQQLCKVIGQLLSHISGSAFRKSVLDKPCPSCLLSAINLKPLLHKLKWDASNSRFLSSPSAESLKQLRCWACQRIPFMTQQQYSKLYQSLFCVHSFNAHLKHSFLTRSEYYWNNFFIRNSTRAYKNRHYLTQVFPELTTGNLLILEAGCGVGNSTFPLLQLNPTLQFFSFDFSKHAITLMKANNAYKPNCITAFVHDILAPKMPDFVKPNSVDFVLLIFVLSSVAPEKRVAALSNLKTYLTDGGSILFRDYATQDLAQKRFEKSSKLSKKQLDENLYVRVDGTLVTYFSTEMLLDLCGIAGLEVERLEYEHREVVNQKLNLTMQRRFIFGKFTKS